MKRILSSSICLVIVFQMIFAPTVAYAQSLGSFLNAGLNGIAGGLQGQNQAPSDPNANANMAALQQNQTATNTDKQFTFDNLSKIPGLVQYMATQKPALNPAALNCTTLMTTLNEVKFDGCSPSPTTLNVPLAESAARAAVYKDQYDKIAKLYTNYSSTSNNQGQAFGVGCMKNVMDILKGYFNYRKGELSKFAAEIDALTAQFNSDAKGYITGMEDDTAVLEGKNAEGLIDKAKTRNPALFDYGKRFNNPACTSIFAANDFNTKGTAGGLNNINQDLKTLISATDAPSKYNGQTYMSSNASVIQDINTLSTSVQNQANLDFSKIASGEEKLGDFYRGLSSVANSPDGENNALNSAMFANSTNSFNTQNQTNQNSLATVNAELSASGISGASLTRLVTNNNLGGFEQELTNVTNQINNTCIQSNLKDQNSVDNVMGRLDTLSGISSFAKSQSSNIKARIASIMNNPGTSIAQKTSLLSSVDSEFGNRYILTRDNEYFYPVIDANGNPVMENGNVKMKSVPASTNETPGTYFTNVMKNCQAQFAVNKLGSQMTGAQVLNKIRDLRTSYSNMKNEFANNLANQVKTKMLTCTSPALANASTSGSCSAASFNPAGANFCVANATKCAGNMQSCTAGAQKFVDEIKTDRTTKVNAYNDRINSYKTQLVRDFGTLLAKFQSEGEALNNVLKAGYNAPEGIKTEVPEESRYLASFKNATQQSTDGQLLVEDPAQLAIMFRNNINALKASVEKQQEDVMNDSSPLRAQIKNTEDNYKKVAADAQKLSRDCEAGRAYFTNALQEQAKQAQKLGEQRNGVCSIYAAGDSNNPASFCTGNIEDVMTVDKTAGSKLKFFCNRYNNHDSENSGSSASIGEACSKKAKAAFPDVKIICEKRDTQYDDCVKSNNQPRSKDVEALDCNDQLKKLDQDAIGAYSDAKSDSLKPSDLPEAPSYCNAGDNSGRDNLDQAISNLGVTIGSSSQAIGK